MRNIAISLAATLAVCACGTNLLKNGEKKDPAEDATIDLERDDPTGAINILTSALDGDPGNPKYLSILALAYAQRAGIEPLKFASKFAAQQGASDSSTATGTATSTTAAAGSSMTALFSIMPDPTADNIADVDKAVSILATQIPAAQRQPGDPFKLAIYQTAAFTLHLKALDANGDGILEADEIINLSDGNATDLVTQLADAATLLGANPSDASSVQASAAITKYKTQIDAAPGATTADKLKGFLAANPGAASQIGSLTATATDTTTAP